MTIIARLKRAFVALKTSAPMPGPTHIAKGTIPADQSLKRLPFLVWGDGFLNGDRPQVRRALAGADAHECMYTWVYINELMAVRSLLNVIQKNDFTVPSSNAEIGRRFGEIRGAAEDLQKQITGELVDVFLPVAVFVALSGPMNTEVCELGSTFFASIEKLEFCSRLIGLPLDRKSLKFELLPVWWTPR
jgi:hypothetical protein